MFVSVLNRAAWCWVILMSVAWAQRPVLHLRMDREATAGQVSDQSRKRNHAQPYGNLTYVPDRFGQDCRALRFDGNSYLSVKHDRSLNLKRKFSLTTWLYLPTRNQWQGLEWLTLICKGETPAESDFSPAYRVQMTSATASVNTASTKSIGRIRQSFPIERWFHFACVYDGRELVVYQDGRVTARFALADMVYANNEPLNIGRDVPGNNELFVGTMDDLRLFDQALSAREVQRIYQDDADQGLGSGCQRTAATESQPPRPSYTPPDTGVMANAAQNNLTLLLDVSGSMDQPGKLPLLKEAFLDLIQQMRPEDYISVVTYAGGVKVKVEHMSATNTQRIAKAIDKLSSGGKTNGKKGLKKAYKVALEHFIVGGNNRVILATDGSFALEDLYPIAEDMANDALFLSVFSFGKKGQRAMGRLDDLASRGQGRHYNITSQNVDQALIQEVTAIKQ